MFLSFALDDRSPSASFRFLEKEDVFNVAITRARSSLVLVGDRESSDMGSLPMMKRFIQYVDSLQPVGRSLMPDGLLQDMSDQQLRDFFAYLRISQPISR